MLATWIKILKQWNNPILYIMSEANSKRKNPTVLISIIVGWYNPIYIILIMLEIMLCWVIIQFNYEAGHGGAGGWDGRITMSLRLDCTT